MNCLLYFILFLHGIPRKPFYMPFILIDSIKLLRNSTNRFLSIHIFINTFEYIIILCIISEQIYCDHKCSFWLLIKGNDFTFKPTHQRNFSTAEYDYGQ